MLSVDDGDDDKMITMDGLSIASILSFQDDFYLIWWWWDERRWLKMFLNEREQEYLFVARTLVLLSSTLGHDDIDNNSNVKVFVTKVCKYVI